MKSRSAENDCSPASANIDAVLEYCHVIYHMWTRIIKWLFLKYTVYLTPQTQLHHQKSNISFSPKTTDSVVWEARILKFREEYESTRAENSLLFSLETKPFNLIAENLHHPDREMSAPRLYDYINFHRHATICSLVCVHTSTGAEGKLSIERIKERLLLIKKRNLSPENVSLDIDYSSKLNHRWVLSIISVVSKI